MASLVHVHVFIASIVITSFIALHLLVVECIGLLFYKNYIVYYNVYRDYFGVFIEQYAYVPRSDFCVRHQRLVGTHETRDTPETGGDSLDQRDTRDW